jgi:hypothetical protein
MRCARGSPLAALPARHPRRTGHFARSRLRKAMSTTYCTPPLLLWTRTSI